MIMKKVLLTLLAFLAVGGAWADELTVPDVTLKAGARGVICLNLTTVDHAYANWNFDLVLPEGISPVLDGTSGDPVSEITERSAGYSMTNAAVEGNTYRYTGYLFSLDPYFKGTEGAIVKIPVTAKADLATGTKLTGQVVDFHTSYEDGDNNMIDVPFAADFNIIIGTPTIALDENATKLPDEVSAGVVANVEVARTIKAGQWSTVVLPFKMSQSVAKSVFGTDAKYAQLSKVVTTYEDEDNVPDAIEIQFESFTVPRAGLAAGQMYLVQTTADVTNFTVENAEMDPTLTPVTGKDNEGSATKLTGSYVKTVIPENGLFISDNKFYYSKGETNIKGFRTWFELEAILGQETPFAKINFSVDDETTAIDGINTQRVIEGVYDLQGRKMKIENNDLNSLQKGVYIIDGKKVTIK